MKENKVKKEQENSMLPFLAILILGTVGLIILSPYLPSNNLLGQAAGASSAYTVRLDAGSTTPYTDSSGNVWQADKPYKPGSFGFVGGLAYNTANKINRTRDPKLYQTERFEMSAYKFTVPNGFYNVTLKFAEIYQYGCFSGSRTFNVLIQNSLILKDFDIYRQAGACYRAIDRSYLVNVANGLLTITFVKIDSPAINAIEVKEVQMLQTLVLSPGSAGIETGHPLQLAAWALDTKGREIRDLGYSWQTSAPATVSPSGLFSSDSEGVFQVKVSATQGNLRKSVTAVINVTAPNRVLSRVEILPTTANLSPGQQVQFTAKAYDSNNQEMSANLDWYSDETAGAIDSNGYFTAGANLGTYDGAVRVNANSNGMSAKAFAQVRILDSAASTCTDTDGGRNYGIKGTADNGQFSVTDYCGDAHLLNEAYCNEEKLLIEPVNCSCSDGKCTNEPCRDSCSGDFKDKCNSYGDILSCADINGDSCKETTLVSCSKSTLCVHDACISPATYTYNPQTDVFVKSVFDFPVSCRVVCGGLCYNAENITCVDGKAEVSYYLGQFKWVEVRDISPERYYELGSNSKRQFNLTNNLDHDINDTARLYFYPNAWIPTSTWIYAGEIELNSYKYALKARESIILNITVPTSAVTLNSLIYLYSHSTGTYVSNTFSVLNSSEPIAVCANFSYNPRFIGGHYRGIYNINNIALCHDNIFVPLGPLGCNSNEDCPGDYTCIVNHCTTTHPDRSAENIRFVSVLLSLSPNSSLNDLVEQRLTDQIGKLKQRLQAIGAQYPNPKSFTVASIRCSRTATDTKAFMLALKDGDPLLKDKVFEFCAIPPSNYTHVFIATPLDQLTADDQLLTTMKIMGGTVAAALYIGNGVMVGQIYSGNLIPDETTEYGEPRPFKLWPVLLHEMIHSFGVPDIYPSAGNVGSNYLWGDCRIMLAKPVMLDTPLCPLEASYFS